MLSAKEAGERATRHMANLLQAEEEEGGTWYIDTCQLAVFAHDSYWYPDGVHFNITDDSTLVYRTVVMYVRPGLLFRKKQRMILSIDAETGELRGYKAILPPKKNYSGIIALAVSVIAVAAIIVTADVIVHQHLLSHHGG